MSSRRPRMLVLVVIALALTVVGVPATGPAQGAGDALRVSARSDAGTMLMRSTLRGTTAVSDGAGPVARAKVAVSAVRGDGFRRSTTVTTDSNGRARFALSKLKAGTYKLSATSTVGDRRATAPTSTVYVQTDRGVTIMLNDGRDLRFGAGEEVWIRGRAVDHKGKPLKGRSVVVTTYSGSQSARLGTVKTDKNGWYSLASRRWRTARYDARISTSAYSVRVTFSAVDDRTLEDRAASLAFGIGSPTGPVVTSRKGRTRDYTRGTLVEVGSHTWYVRDRLRTTWLRNGGLSGKLGAPTMDERCRLPERGCLQEFEHGAIYDSPRGTHAVVGDVDSVKTAFAAVALSQTGLMGDAALKYRKWLYPKGSTVPWCGIFLSWLAYAAGDQAAIPAAKDYAELIAIMRKRAMLHDEPAVGRLAFISNVMPGTPTHAGIVVAVGKGSVTTVEGNVDANGGPKLPRGVERVVHTDPDDIIFYADPLG